MNETAPVNRASLWRTAAELAGLTRVPDLSLLLWPPLWAAWLVSEGAPQASRLVALVLALLLARSAAWIAYAPEVPELRQIPRERLPLAALFGVGALCFALPIGWPGLLVPLAFGMLAVWFSLRARSYLSDPLLATALALPAMAAWFAFGAASKTAGLLGLATVLWLLAALLVTPLQRNGATLARLAEAKAPLAIALLQLAALGALALAGREAHLGVFFQLGLLAALGLTGYQALTRRRPHPPSPAVLAAWWGAAVFCGIAFHFLCACQAASQA